MYKFYPPVPLYTRPSCPYYLRYPPVPTITPNSLLSTPASCPYYHPPVTTIYSNLMSLYYHPPVPTITLLSCENISVPLSPRAESAGPALGG